MLDTLAQPRTRVRHTLLSAAAMSDRLALGLLVVLLVLVYLLNWDLIQVGAYQDDARYVVTARALAAGQGFSISDQRTLRPETTYPPGYPLLLAPLARLAPGSLEALKIPSLLLTICAVPLVFGLFRRRFSLLPATLAVAAVFLNPLMVSAATTVMSEALFFVCLAALCTYVERFERDEGKQGSIRLATCLRIGGMLIVLYFVRTAGLLVIGATLTYFLLTRRTRGAVAIAGLVAGPVLAWTLRNMSLSGGMLSPGYEAAVTSVAVTPATGSAAPLSWFGSIAATAQGYATEIVAEALGLGLTHHATARALLGALSTFGLSALVPLVVTGLVGVGLIWRLRMQPRFLEASAALFCLGLLLWPLPTSRLLLPVLPTLCVALVEGVAWFVRRLPGLAKAGPRVAVLVLVGLVLGEAGLALQSARTPASGRATDLRLGANWIAENTPADAVVMAEFPISRSLYTQRAMVDLPPTRVQDLNAAEAIRCTGATYVFLAPPVRSPPATTLDTPAIELESAILDQPDSFQLVLAEPDRNVRIYAVRPPDSSLPVQGSASLACLGR